MHTVTNTNYDCDAQVTQLCPNHLCKTTSEPVHITCVRYNCFGELVATYNDEVCERLHL